MPPMDVKRYLEKNPHLRPIDEVSEPSASVQGKKMSDLQNLAKQVSASKQKLQTADDQISESGFQDASQYEEFKDTK